MERGQSWIWAAGNGADRAGLTVNPTHLWGYSAADWNVVVGGLRGPHDRQTGHSIPVDIVSYSDLSRSAGGASANGEGSHSGTSAAAPAVAGTFARTIQLGRDLLGDVTPGHADGVVGRGAIRPCEGTVKTCPLDDGELTRDEVQAVVFHNVMPAPARPQEVPRVLGQQFVDSMTTTPANNVSYIWQGHGIVHGLRDHGAYVAERRRFSEALRGVVPPLRRPPAEPNWMVADSKCRQRLWGKWAEGYFRGVEPTFDPVVDQPAMAWDAACTPAPYGALARGVPKPNLEPLKSL